MPIPVENRAPWKGYRKFAFPVLWVLLLGFFFLLRENLAPFIGAILIAFLLAPFVRLLRRVKIKGLILPRWGAILVIYVLLGGVVGLYTAVAIPKVGAEVAKLAEEGNQFFQSLTPAKIDEYTRDFRDWVEETGLPVKLMTPRLPLDPKDARAGFVLNLDEVVRRTVADLSESLRVHFFDFLKLGPKFAATAIRSVLMTFLILMVAAFLLSDPERVLGFVRKLFPARLQAGYDEVLVEIDQGLSGVVRGQVLIGLLNGVLTFIGMLLLGVKFPVLLSSLTAVLSLIPIFGSFLAAIPITAVGLTDGFGTGFGIMLWLIGINLSEANYFNPKIIGHQAKIHPALVVFALLAGERLYGVIGALFAVPLLSVGLAFFRALHIRAQRWNKEHYSQEQDSSASSPSAEPGLEP